MSRILLKTIKCIIYVFSLALMCTSLFPVGNIFGSTPLVTTGAATNITATSATLNGSIRDYSDDRDDRDDSDDDDDKDDSDDSASVSFEWGVTTAYGNTTPDQNLGKKDKGNFSAYLTNLSPGTVYHFRAKAGTSYGSDQVFTTSTVSPIVVTGTAGNITTTGATISGDLVAKGSAASVAVSFEYGTTTAYGSTAVAINPTLTNTGVFTANLTGLTPGTVYHFRAKAGTSYGSDQIFTTSTIPLTVVTGTAVNITTTGATIRGDLVSKGTAASVAVSFEYGTTTAYGSMAAGIPPTLANPGVFTANLTGLTPGTVYHFRATAVGATTIYGGDATFTLLTGTTQSVGGGTVDNSDAGDSVGNSDARGTIGVPIPAVNTVSLAGLISEAGLMLDNDGVVLDATKLKTADDYVSINIERGTTLLDIDGQAIKALTASPQLSPPLPPQTSALLFSYDFGPDGAQFIPSVTLSYKYDTQSLPAGVDINTLYIALWDGKNWQQLDTQIDAVSNTVSTPVTGFSQYALMAKLPANFTLTAFIITPSLSQIGEVVDIAVACTNVGGSPGEYPVILKVNDVEEDRQVITLDPGASRVALFQVTKSLPGTYTVDVNGLVSNFVTVQAEPSSPASPASPASFTFTTFGITPPLSQVGDIIDIAVTCTNIGESQGDYPVILKVNDVEEDRQVITLDPGASRVALFQVTKSLPGTYTVDVNGLASNFVVQAAPEETPIRSANQLLTIFAGFALFIFIVIFVLYLKY